MKPGMHQSYDNYELDLEELLSSYTQTVEKLDDACVNYLKIIEVYSRIIKECEDVEEAREWADRMITHALKVEL